MEYNVEIGSGEILEGSVTGKIHFHFNKNGLVVEIPDTEQHFSKKNINGISFKTTIRDKIKKGSTLAKIAAFKAASNSNNKNIGQQIAMSQRFADMGRDSVVQEETKIAMINIKSLGDLVIDFGSSSDIQKKLVKAYNNPKSFFKESVKDQVSQTKLKKNSVNFSKKTGKAILWMCAWPGPIMLFKFFSDVDSFINDPEFSTLLFIIVLFNLPLVYLIYSHTKWGNKSTSKKDLKSKWEKFENSKEYEEILKNLS